MAITGYEPLLSCKRKKLGGLYVANCSAITKMKLDQSPVNEFGNLLWGVSGWQ